MGLQGEWVPLDRITESIVSGSQWIRTVQPKRISAADTAMSLVASMIIGERERAVVLSNEKETTSEKF